MIEKLRKEIDRIDNNIIELLSKRKGAVKKIAGIKRQENTPVIDKGREQEIINRLKKLSKENGLDENFIGSVYGIIIDNSRNEQER